MKRKIAATFLVLVLIAVLFLAISFVLGQGPADEEAPSAYHIAPYEPVLGGDDPSFSGSITYNAWGQAFEVRNVSIHLVDSDCDIIETVRFGKVNHSSAKNPPRKNFTGVEQPPARFVIDAPKGHSDPAGEYLNTHGLVRRVENGTVEWHRYDIEEPPQPSTWCEEAGVGEH